MKVFAGMALARSIIVFTFICSVLAHEPTAAAQELSPVILRTIPKVAERLHSTDINERLSVLDELVTVKQGEHLPQLIFPYNLPASDYSVVVQSILAGNLEQVDERRALTMWWKLNHVVIVFKLRELAKPLARYLPNSTPPIQYDILRTLRALQAVETVPQIVTVLNSPRENIRRLALDTLVDLRAREAVPFLLALMQDKDEAQRYYAMTSLVKANGREAAVEVVKLLEDQSKENRYWALDALVKLNAREHAQAFWKLTNADQSSPSQAYALAALVYFGEPRAIPLVVKKATDPDLSRRSEMMEYLVKVKANAIVPAFVALLESRAVLGGNPSDIGTDGNIRREIMKCLGQLEAREAIPVLRSYARRRDANNFLQQGAVETLGILHARETVDDLLPLLDKTVTGDEYATADAAVALAQIGEQRTWRQLIDLAAQPSCPYRSEIISELNRHLDRELWDRVQTQKVHGLYVKSVKTTAEAFSRDSGIRIVLDYEPGRDSSGHASLDNDGYPWANTSVEEISLSYGLHQLIEGLSDGRTPPTFTFIFDDKQIHILSVERAIEWWRKQILNKK